MITSAAPLQPVNFRQLNDLLTTASSRSKLHEPFLKRAQSPDRLLMHIEKELPSSPAPIIFRRLGRHTQLCIQFS